LCACNSTIALQYIWNIFRVVEFAQGYAGHLATHEVYLYIFDFAPIYACFLFFTFMHYGFWLGPRAAARNSRLPAHADVEVIPQAVAAAGSAVKQPSSSTEVVQFVVN
jgi:hypothetical protein